MFEDPSYKGMYLVSKIVTGIGANKGFAQQKYSVEDVAGYTVNFKCKRRWDPSRMILTTWLVEIEQYQIKRGCEHSSID